MSIGVHAEETRAEGIARRIRGLMGEQRVSQKRVGMALGLSHTAVARRSTGEVEYGITEIEMLADLFGVSEAYLYGFSQARGPVTSK